MFENYKGAKNRKMPAWAPPLIIAALVFHAAAVMTMWIKSIWEVEKLELPKGRISLSGQFAPPPPPPPPKAGKKPEDVKKDIIKKKKVEEIVQKPTEEQILKPNEATAPSNAEVGIGEGEGTGNSEGMEGGEGIEEPVKPPPPAPPQNVAPTALKANQIAGEQQIIPDDVTKIEIQRSGKAKVVASYKMCINAAGNPQSVTMLKSTGFPAYDAKIKREMDNWRYRPFLINGRAAPVCTAVTFIYSQK
jgi:outer membrane biosynthesis protein TonB